MSFEATPLENLGTRHLDSWALRATIGSHHGSRTGRLNASPALPLILPTDAPAGAFASLAATPGVTPVSWRGALSAVLNDINATPYSPHLRAGASLALTDNAGLDTPTLFRARPSVFIAGARLSLAYHHYSPTIRCPHLSSMSWVTVNMASAESPSLEARTSRTLLSPAYAPALPTLDNLGGSSPVPNTEISACPDIDLSFLRAPLKPSKQHLL